jgi:hypothetical protein
MTIVIYDILYNQNARAHTARALFWKLKHLSGNLAHRLNQSNLHPYIQILSQDIEQSQYVDMYPYRKW